MSDEIAKKLNGIDYWGYYDENKTFILEIPKESLIKYLKKEFDVDNIKIS